jgi:hypothetical protein
LKTRNIAHTNTHTHTHTHKIKQNLSIFIAWGMLLAIAESPGVMLLRGQNQHFKKIMLRKICDVTSFPQIFLYGRHTATFMQRNKQSVIHLSLGLKESIELKSFLLRQ